MRDTSSRVSPETELNPAEKRRLTELAEAFVFQSERMAWGVDYNFQRFSLAGSSELTLDSVPQLDPLEMGKHSSSEDDITSYWFCDKL